MPVNEQQYPDLGGDFCNRLQKEVAATNVQIYYEADAKIFVPFEEIIRAENSGDPKSLFERVSISRVNQ